MKEYENDIRSIPDEELWDLCFSGEVEEKLEKESCFEELKYRFLNNKESVSVHQQVEILKEVMDELMHTFDNEEDKMDFIFDITNLHQEKIRNRGSAMGSNKSTNETINPQ